MPWKVQYFQTARGNSPVRDFLVTQGFLNPALMSKVDIFIQILEIKGPFLRPPFIKKLQKNLYELRVMSRPPLRIFYTQKGQNFILLHVFFKKNAENTPERAEDCPCQNEKAHIAYML